MSPAHRKRMTCPSHHAAPHKPCQVTRVPAPLSDAAAAKIAQLLGEGLSAAEVSRRRVGRYPKVTPQRVRQEAYKLGVELRRGALPGQGNGGRPMGAKDQKARAIRSDKRTLIMQLWADGERNQSVIAEKSETSRQYVFKIIQGLNGTDAETK